MKTNDKKEIDIIKRSVMDYYHEGHVKNDPELYEQILHDEWKLFWLDDNGKLQIADKKEYLSWYKPEEVDKTLHWETEFFYVDVTENIAAVKLRLECEKVMYIDYFNMMKIKGTWQIIHKVSHAQHK
ncbi:nuclear transport factor 2 family protein [candidate division KSB1 bacterium]